ncbi:MAG: DUF5009 domain-containing protein [Paramuribaculum sp.]|nr:DUF5009 domain-containing protein [Paramuribaculum sp.]
MPLFLFMVGTAMPFAFARFQNDSTLDRRGAYRRIARRFLLLFLFGMIVQGNLLALNPATIKIYTNTLQAIAFGYLTASMIVLHLHLRGQLIATALLLLIYWVPMAFAGDYSLEGSFAYRVDKLIIGDFRGDPSYTWIWSSLTFGVTVMLGSFAGTMMKGVVPALRTKRACLMVLVGMGLILAGMLWSIEQPVIKRLWTASMTLISGGICFLLMALFYWWIDASGHSRGLNWLKIYGTNAITAYVLGEVVSFRSVVHSVSFGLQHIIGAEWYNVWLTFGNFGVLFLILSIMYRTQTHLKL